MENSKIELKLRDRKGSLAAVSWDDHNDLSKKLLSMIEKLLKKGKTSLDNISGYKIISEVPSGWTTCRLAEITLKSLMLARIAP